MTHKYQGAGGGRPAAATAERKVGSNKEGPYLKLFGVDIGVSEFELHKRTITIGRSSNNDLQLPNRAVSRGHATITHQGDEYTLIDANSTSGTTVNGEPVESRVLQHGDTIGIAMYLLQFCTYREQQGVEEAAAQAKLLLRAEYCSLPSTMQVRYRLLEFGPMSAFESGNTLKIGQGGLLIPTSEPPSDGSCLELELTMGGGTTRQFLGEIMGIIHKGGTDWMCVKLHTISKRSHEVVVAGAKPGSWIDVPKT
jgi:hypothetical protein